MTENFIVSAPQTLILYIVIKHQSLHFQAQKLPNVWLGRQDSFFELNVSHLDYKHTTRLCIVLCASFFIRDISGLSSHSSQPIIPEAAVGATLPEKQTQSPRGFLEPSKKLRRGRKRNSQGYI